MKLPLLGRIGAVALVGTLALTLSACGSDNADRHAGSPPARGSDAPASTLSGTLNGGGSSAQEKAQQAWVAGFQTANPDVTVNYTTTDSGAGRKGFLDASLDYAGSDSALNEEELASVHRPLLRRRRHRPAGLHQPDRRGVQHRRRHRAEPERGRRRQDLRRRDHHVGRRGDHRA